jgi:hypothetical protein
VKAVKVSASEVNINGLVSLQQEATHHFREHPNLSQKNAICRKKRVMLESLKRTWSVPKLVDRNWDVGIDQT